MFLHETYTASLKKNCTMKKLRENDENLPNTFKKYKKTAQNLLLTFIQHVDDADACYDLTLTLGAIFTFQIQIIYAIFFFKYKKCNPSKTSYGI